jgi:hypothetical protein
MDLRQLLAAGQLGRLSTTVGSLDEERETDVGIILSKEAPICKNIALFTRKSVKDDFSRS